MEYRFASIISPTHFSSHYLNHKTHWILSVFGALLDEEASDAVKIRGVALWSRGSIGTLSKAKVVLFPSIFDGEHNKFDHIMGRGGAEDDRRWPRASAGMGVASTSTFGSGNFWCDSSIKSAGEEITDVGVIASSSRKRAATLYRGTGWAMLPKMNEAGFEMTEPDCET